MSPSALQERIDQIPWYHEFDFGDGLVARSNAEDVEWHRRLWGFVKQELDLIDFRGKTVLDIGCWDGYWSFYAERRGAKSVLATDDVSQNWANGEGLRVAKQLLKSNVETKQDVSVYRLDALGRTFDVVLCLGVYYHLVDPFYAFAQIRHCCHPGSIVVFDGDVGLLAMPAKHVKFAIADPGGPQFLPSESGLNDMLQAAYLSVARQTYLNPPAPQQKGLIASLYYALHGNPYNQVYNARGITVCKPMSGTNSIHHHTPPFGLAHYDDRFRDSEEPALKRCA